MLEVDLLQGGDWGQDGRSRKPVSRVRSRRLSRDGWIIGSALVVLISLGLAAYFALSIRTRAAGLEAALQAALADSVRSTALIGKMRTLEARRDSIAARVAIIQEIDGRRYLWPRLMDEVAGVLPEEAWLTRFAQVTSEEATAGFEVEGMARDNFSLTRFWNGMESSPFIRNVRLISTENIPGEVSGGAGGDLYYFVLQAEPEDPSPDVLDFMPVQPVAAR